MYGPLFEAIKSNNFDVVAALLDRRPDLDVRDCDLDAPLHIAVIWRRDRMLDLLIERGACVNVVNRNGYTPLHYAAGDSEIMVQILLRKGAVVDARNNGGQTPLHRAAMDGQEQIVEMLLRGGANIEAETKLRNRPLRVATTHLMIGAVEMLLRHGADPDARGMDSETPLHIASRLDSLPIVNILLDHGADTSIKSDDGKTPADVATKREILEALTARRPSEWTPANHLRRATLRHRATIREVLLARVQSGLLQHLPAEVLHLIFAHLVGLRGATRGAE